MATTRVFVDNAVLGRLPPVCTKTGLSTTDLLSFRTAVGGSEGLGIAWLLLLLGPFGWLGLAIYAMTRRSETLTVKLPYCESAYAELRNGRRIKRNAGVASIVFLVLALLLLIPQTFAAHAGAAALGAIGLGMLLMYSVKSFHVRRMVVGVELDGSRRWVTLNGVSDAFANAVSRSEVDHLTDRTW
jgi:hypothetical protein